MSYTSARMQELRGKNLEMVRVERVENGQQVCFVVCTHHSMCAFVSILLCVRVNMFDIFLQACVKMLCRDTIVAIFPFVSTSLTHACVHAFPERTSQPTALIDSMNSFAIARN